MTSIEAISILYQTIGMGLMWGVLCGILIIWLPKHFK
jgi:NhaP-type Na+/H+ or K+/H+ antiporter